MKFYRLALGALFLALLLLAGCASEEAQQVAANASANAPDDAFKAKVTLCRKIGRKSGRRIGVGHEFTMGKKSYVRAFVDFTNVKPERPYTVHLVWVRPDGKELFRKYANVIQDQTDTGQHKTIITWLDAEDLHKVKTDTLRAKEPSFTLDTRFNISKHKNREPGEYHLLVYLDRRLLLDEPFMVKAKS